MRVAIVYDARESRQKLVAQALQNILQKDRHTVNLHRMAEGAKLTGCQYIILLSETVSFFRGKIPEQIAYFLSQAGNLVGKKAAAVIIRRPGFGQLRGLRNLMRAMEKEGLIVHYSDIASKAVELSTLCKSLGS